MRYVLHPGQIKSQNDGDIHYISPGALIMLYGLCPRCQWTRHDYLGYRDLRTDVHLRPLYNGSYFNVHEKYGPHENSSQPPS